VLTIGAGDITKTGPELLEALGARCLTHCCNGAPRRWRRRRLGPRARLRRRTAVVGTARDRRDCESVVGTRYHREPLSFFRVRRVEIVGVRYLAPSDIVARLRGGHDAIRVG
jgi:hypothetical protein